MSSCLRTAESKKVTLACFDRGAWTRLRVLNRNAGTTRKTTFVGPRFWGPKFGPQNGGHITIFFYDGSHFGVRNLDPKMGSRRSGVFGAGALSKDSFRQQVTQWACACPCLCPFCLVVTLILADSFAFSRTGGAPLSATGFCADFLTSFWAPLEQPVFLEGSR